MVARDITILGLEGRHNETLLYSLVFPDGSVVSSDRIPFYGNGDINGDVLFQSFVRHSDFSNISDSKLKKVLQRYANESKRGVHWTQKTYRFFGKGETNNPVRSMLSEREYCDTFVLTQDKSDIELEDKKSSNKQYDRLTDRIFYSCIWQKDNLDKINLVHPEAFR